MIFKGISGVHTQQSGYNNLAIYNHIVNKASPKTSETQWKEFDLEFQG